MTQFSSTEALFRESDASRDGIQDLLLAPSAFGVCTVHGHACKAVLCRVRHLLCLSQHFDCSSCPRSQVSDLSRHLPPENLFSWRCQAFEPESFSYKTGALPLTFGTSRNLVKILATQTLAISPSFGKSPQNLVLEVWGCPQSGLHMLLSIELRRPFPRSLAEFFPNCNSQNSDHCVSKDQVFLPSIQSSILGALPLPLKCVRRHQLPALVISHAVPWRCQEAIIPCGRCSATRSPPHPLLAKLCVPQAFGLPFVKCRGQ